MSSRTLNLVDVQPGMRLTTVGAGDLRDGAPDVGPGLVGRGNCCEVVLFADRFSDR